MIITNLIGGLGNQLFQFAAGMSLAQRTGAELRVAVDMFRDYRLHQGYELSRVFELAPATADADDLRRSLGAWRGVLPRRVLGQLVQGAWLGGRMLLHRGHGYMPAFADVEAPVYLQGYWQSERYFDGAQTAIRQALRFRQPPSAQNASWLDRMQVPHSVAMHVRRGDYVSNSKNTRLYAQCTPEYYRAAMDTVLARHSQARFFVFSDDPAWARGLFADRPEPVEVVDHNRGAESYNDLRLMSHCKHIVIANSTFSWWAAWLGERPDGMVIAPRRWYLPAGFDADLIPGRWLRL